MIFASLDLNEEGLDEMLDSFKSIKESKFDGVEICLWQDMNKHTTAIRRGLEDAGLASNVHNDLMREKEGEDYCRKKLSSSLKFYKSINGKKFISHPIKPYPLNIGLSKRLFDEFKEDILIESVKDIRIPELYFLNRPIVLDIGSIIKNGENGKISEYQKVEWLHIHDILNDEDHLPIGRGSLDLDALIRKFPDIGYTIELGRTFRRWSDLKKEYGGSIDCVNNSVIRCSSYGKNIRLKHLISLVRNQNLESALEFGCGEGYLVHNVTARDKRGYDLNPLPVFNDVSYSIHNLSNPPPNHANLIICSEVLEHIRDDRKAIKNLYAALNPRGRIFLSTLNKNCEDKSALDLKRGHLRRYGPELRNIMEKEGFSTIAFYPIRSPHYYNNKCNLDSYSIEEDIREGETHASGWIYFGEAKK